MKNPVLLIAVFCITISCVRYPDPEVKLVKNYSFGFMTQGGQKFLSGEWINDSITFYGNDNNNAQKDSVKVLFEVVKGGGTVTVPSAYTNKYGNVSTKWKLGTQSFEQELRAITYDTSGNYLTSTNLMEYGFRENAWDTCTFSPDGNIMEMFADTINKFTLVITNNQIYKEGDRYYLWEPVNDPVLVLPRTLMADKNGVIYVSTWNGELVKSSDHGNTWNTCTKPFPDRPYFFYPYISNDNYVWAYIWDHPTKYSKDGGMSWIELPDGNPIDPQGFGDIFRLKDGSLLFHGSGCCSLNRSFDNGQTWTKIETPGYSVKIFVNEKDEFYLISQGAGTIGIYKSTDYGISFDPLYAIAPQFITEMDKLFNKWGNFYYVLMPGFGILKSYDLNTYDVYWTNKNLNKLFIDHNGVMIAKDWNMNTIYYRKNTE
jgi:hypothetical protein